MGEYSTTQSSAVALVIVTHALLFNICSDCLPDIDPGKEIFERILQLADPSNAMQQKLDPLELGSSILNDYTNWASLKSMVRNLPWVVVHHSHICMVDQLADL